jgi:ketosteroid isomerase-like protein
MQTIFRRILQLRLDATGRAVESFRVLVARQPRFREITTGVVVGDDLFYVATSQYAALLGGTRPPPPDQLGDIFIMRAGLREKEPRTGRSALEEELRAVETAFARTMAERDSMGFDAFLSEEAIFVGSRSVLRGRGAVSAGWRRFFAGGDAPFSWQPEQAEVLDDGSLGWTSGPVFDPEGKRIGTFNSTWRNEKGGWKILFDRGCPPCPSSP